MPRRPLRLLALDLGAESGRALVGNFDGSHLAMEEVHRFPNVPVQLGGTLYWDFLRLFGDSVTGIHKATSGGELASAGVDTWGVDFGLLDGRGRLLGNPVHYRDARTTGMLARVNREQVYAATGIQVIAINTLYQLLSLVQSRDPDLERANRLLMIADLINHFLCGIDVSEYTIATTSQCLNVATGEWATDLLSDLHIPSRIFPEVVPPGTVVGRFDDTVTVVAPGTHDTASAVAATPLSKTTVF